MKIAGILLAASVVINAGLIAAFAIRPTLVPPEWRDFFARPGSSEGRIAQARADANRREALAASAREVRARSWTWRALDSEDLVTLVARLRAEGFSPALIRAIVGAKIETRFEERMDALKAKVKEMPYWKPGPSSLFGNRAIYEEYAQIRRERARMLRDLLGQDAVAGYGVDPTVAQRRQFGNLSQAKIDLIQLIKDDYDEMASQIRASSQGITLPEDREKLALLEREKQADLAAFLTPQELQDYEMRSSNITARLRTSLSIMDASEEEFRAIYGVHKQFEDDLYPTSTGGMITYGTERTEAQQKVAELLKASFGEQRYADYARASDQEFQQLYRLAQRENIPLTTAVQAFDLRRSATEESNRIYADRSLSNFEKRAALQRLAQNTKNQILGTLGPAAGEGYIRTARWLGYLETGAAVTPGPGSGLRIRHVPQN